MRHQYTENSCDEIVPSQPFRPERALDSLPDGWAVWVQNEERAYVWSRSDRAFYPATSYEA